eukprot:1158630-Pelagomonas_calceolata.AAC.12
MGYRATACMKVYRAPRSESTGKIIFLMVPFNAIQWKTHGEDVYTCTGRCCTCCFAAEKATGVVSCHEKAELCCLTSMLVRNGKDDDEVWRAHVLSCSRWSLTSPQRALAVLADAGPPSSSICYSQPMTPIVADKFGKSNLSIT